MIRLHKRAASRFISHNIDQYSSSQDVKNLFTLWLLYAKCQATFGEIEAARKTFRHIQHTKLGEQEADFYISLARFEATCSLNEETGTGGNSNSLGNAIQILKSGVKKGAEPKKSLDSCLEQLQLAIELPVPGITIDAIMKIHEEQGGSKCSIIQSHAVLDGNNRGLGGASGKVPKLKTKALSIEDKGFFENPIRDGDNVASIGIGIDALKQAKKEVDNDPTLDRSSAGSEKDSENLTSMNRNSAITSTSRTRTRVTSLQAGKRDLSTVESTSSEKVRAQSSSLALLNKKRRLGGGARRGAIGGGAQRITTVTIMDQTLDDEEDETDAPKADISYLLNWNPSGPSNQAAKRAVLEQRAAMKVPGSVPGSEDVATKVVPVLKPVSRFRPVMSIIQEATKDTSVSMLQETTKESNMSNNNISSITESSRSIGSAGLHSGTIQSHGSNTNASKSDNTNDTEKSEIGQKSITSNTSEHSNQSTRSNGNSNGTDESERSRSSSGVRSAKSKKSENDSFDSVPRSGKTSPEANEKQQIMNTNASSNLKMTPSTLEQQSNSSLVHPDFLKIVSPQNIITVNNNPYIKLGVIGKGGSCKVYRTLSRDRSIVAIKKVKIAGMPRKSIEGYANEIALLRRLRGNHAIIQLYESEVDIKRKAIYLVMEPGEVDLNHVVSASQQGLY